MNIVKNRISSRQSSPLPGDNVSRIPSNGTFDTADHDGLSPELVPIVTLLSSQSHRRYHEGIFMLYYDLNGDGKPADREWKEIYGILTGNQLAYWDAANLAQFKQNPEALLEFSAKPNYLNFTDAIYNAMRSLPAAKQNLDNVIIVSTTLKNRYILQFKSYKDLTYWYAALRLSNYEYKSLQEAYTGALLSARGSRLSDIRTILAEKRFDHEDWVSLRYGSGMPWKRCYAVVEPSTLKRKQFTAGRILFYENEQKKKKGLVAVITNATAVTAIYPQSPQLIDHSTMLKMEGYINFISPSLSTKISKKSAEDFRETSVFLMPEQHSAVPGFDTLIRFLIPLLDSFGLYGRPKRLKANRSDIDSLLFGLPTLPRVHYLELQDVLDLIEKSDFLQWNLKAWNSNIQSVLKGKIDRGYEGCGSQRGYTGAVNTLNSPVLSNSPRVASGQAASQFPPVKQVPSNLSQTSFPLGSINNDQYLKDGGKGFGKNYNDLSVGTNRDGERLRSGETFGAGGTGGVGSAGGAGGAGLLDPQQSKQHHKSIQLAEIYQKYSDLKTPSDDFQGRNEVLNGSQEQLIESELPKSMRQMDLNANVNSNKNAYPTNDDGLFSDDDDDDDGSDYNNDDVLANSSDNAKNSNRYSKTTDSSASLQVPGFQERNISYSSVVSPMAQFNDLRDQYKNVEPKQVPFYGLGSESPNPLPSKDTQFGGRIGEIGSTLSLKTQESDTNSYTNTDRSGIASTAADGRKPLQNNAAAPYPVNKPRYISSPNSSQNNVGQFSSNVSEQSKLAPPRNELQYPVSPSANQKNKTSNVLPQTGQNMGSSNYNLSRPANAHQQQLYSQSQPKAHPYSQLQSQQQQPQSQPQSQPRQMQMQMQGNTNYRPYHSSLQNSFQLGQTAPITQTNSQYSQPMSTRPVQQGIAPASASNQFALRSAPNQTLNSSRIPPHGAPAAALATSSGVTPQQGLSSHGRVQGQGGQNFSNMPPYQQQRANHLQQRMQNQGYQNGVPQASNHGQHHLPADPNLRGYDDPRFIYSYNGSTENVYRKPPLLQSSSSEPRHPYAQNSDQFNNGSVRRY